MIHMREEHLTIRNDFCARKMNLEPVGPGNDNNDNKKKNKNNENLIKINLEPVGPGAFVLRRGGGRLPNSIPGSIQSSRHHTPYHTSHISNHIISYQTISYHTISSSNSIPGNLPHHNDHHPLHRHNSPLKPLRFVGKPSKHLLTKL